ncbi:stalk domain-containing protein [Dehalobacterium formicoaceticum]|uniref:Copper amine oxidase N-terminal domain-containing protein n=1 Tax=Dehalobacterium formicoaceticum TaxID=51515 RepID=A0ABT1Y2Y7_9FIRM|nr:stalk domain-containing protein [Dehalobacterium formicoaceticum]MCR6544314.1 copper amine oxidase N-terminal domain-containing protein [Dehalobacterium formicoaceticum]
MKHTLKTGLLVIMIMLIMSGVAVTQVSAQGRDVQVKINRFSEWGEIVQNSIEFEHQEKPRLEQGRVLIPLRKISESLGFTVTYDHKSKKIDLADHTGKKMSLTISDKTAMVNNKPVKMDVPAKVVNQLTFVPLRFVSENFDQVVKWDPSTRTVLIDNFTATRGDGRHEGTVPPCFRVFQNH